MSSGWGRGGWGDGPWGEGYTVTGFAIVVDLGEIAINWRPVPPPDPSVWTLIDISPDANWTLVPAGGNANWTPIN